MRKLVSIIIVNWNGRKWLKECLDSLRTQTYDPIEIILVDNDSVDGSAGFVRENYPEVRVVESGSNLGFAGGNNPGLESAKGDYIFLLNNDTVVDRECVAVLVRAFEKIPKLGSVQAKLITMNDKTKLDVCGSYWTWTSLLYHYGFRKNAQDPKYDQPMPFFSNKGAAMMMSREAIIAAGGLFDDDFWCYYEETDFCHRLWLAGFECWYYPYATVYHYCGSTAKAFANSYIQFHNFKNKLLSFLKNLEMLSLLKVLPVYSALIFFLSIAWLFQGKSGHFAAIYKSVYWNIINLGKTIKKRAQVQKLRKKTDKQIFALVEKNPKWSYYFFLFIAPDKYEE